MDPKSPFLSKTIWTNFIVAAVAFLPDAQGFVSSHPLLLVEVFAGVNLLLRLVTKTGIALQ